MNRGYTVEEAARILGIPTERVWDLVARGIFSGGRGEDGQWRVHLGGAAGEDSEPASAGAQGGSSAEPPPLSGPSGAGGELNPFRELLSEFRHLTERYGQALLALGEARGEVAALTGRIEALETRLDLRLPYSAPPAAAPVPVAPVASEPTEPAVIEPDVIELGGGGMEVAAADVPEHVDQEAEEADETHDAVEDEAAPDEQAPVSDEVAPEQQAPEAQDEPSDDTAEAVAEPETAETAETSETEQSEASTDLDDAEPSSDELTEQAQRPSEDSAEEPTETSDLPPEAFVEAADVEAEPELPDVDLPPVELPSLDDEFETIDDLLVLAGDEGEATADEPEPEAESVAAEPAEGDALAEEPEAREADAVDADSSEAEPEATSEPSELLAVEIEVTSEVEAVVASDDSALADSSDAAFAIDEDQERAQRRRNNRLGEEIAAALARADDPSPPELPNGAEQAPSVSEEERASVSRAEPPAIAPTTQWPPFGARQAKTGEEPLLWIGGQPEEDAEYAAEMEVGSAGWQREEASPAPVSEQDTPVSQVAADDLGADPYPDQNELIDALGWEHDEVEAIRSLLSGQVSMPRRAWPTTDPDLRAETPADQPDADVTDEPSDDPAGVSTVVEAMPVDGPTVGQPTEAEVQEAAEEPAEPPEPSQEVRSEPHWPAVDQPIGAREASGASREPGAFELPGADDLDAALAALRRRSAEEAASERQPNDDPTSGHAAVSEDAPGPPSDAEPESEQQERSEVPAAEQDRAEGEAAVEQQETPSAATPRPASRPESALDDPAWSRRSPAANAYRRLRRFLGG